MPRIPPAPWRWGSLLITAEWACDWCGKGFSLDAKADRDRRRHRRVEFFCGPGCEKARLRSESPDNEGEDTDNDEENQNHAHWRF